MSAYDIDDLRRSLAAHADDAPDGPDVVAGVVAAAREHGLRRRRRRRGAVAAGITAALVATAGATPVILDGFGSDQAAPATVTAPKTPGPPGVIGHLLSAKPGGIFYASNVTIQSDTQRMSLRAENGGQPPGGDVALQSPGTFDPNPARKKGEPVTVNGRPGFFLADTQAAYPQVNLLVPVRGGPDRVESIVWEAEPGLWALAATFFPSGKAAVLQVAESTVVGALAPLPAPYHFGYLPTGLIAQAANTMQSGPGAGLAFGTAADPVPDGRMPIGRGAELTVQTQVESDEMTARTSGLGVPTRVGAYDTWYFDSANPGSFVVPWDGGAVLTVKSQHCWAIFNSADSDRIGRAELEKIVAATEFKDCGDQATWVNPLG